MPLLYTGKKPGYSSYSFNTLFGSKISKEIHSFHVMGLALEELQNNEEPAARLLEAWIIFHGIKDLPDRIEVEKTLTIGGLA
jgi:hypothetical protein